MVLINLLLPVLEDFLIGKGGGGGAMGTFGFIIRNKGSNCRSSSSSVGYRPPLSVGKLSTVESECIRHHLLLTTPITHPPC